ncbi:ABC-type organic anion transporter ABCA8B isoform 3 [Mus musculus]|uniref:ABC-type organic anion transporter ABCA8B isoform 3 n=1 Tax=Mus musculus TaxID=10090 RepID=UPI0003D6EB99|nr:ABC-type organic anion transporter ABCA8B isoform 3 [Mus musculus]|eukprot:XP_006533523.1 PREDICTED: ATP-binding cassette sub-family A member 8-B isoform X2 [Mus musculus]
MIKREISVRQQTCALLQKNLLKKWRLKRESLMEWVSSLLLLLFLYWYPHGHGATDLSSVPTKDLGRVDSFRQSGFMIGYTPVTSMTQQIMEKVAATPFMADKKVLGLLDEENIKELTESHAEIIRVIFSDTFSYHLKFQFDQRIPTSRELRDHNAHCDGLYEDVNCLIAIFWKEGFVALQAAINAAIIETTTNHSVMEELLSVSGKFMKIHPFVRQEGILTDFFIFTCIISFSPITYYVSINVARERKRMKGLMMMMGLRDPAFWLSWGLLYAGFVFIMALSLALVIKSVQFFILTSFMVVFSLFLLYGLSMITLAFLMSALVRKSVLTGLSVFLLTIFWGSLGFTSLYRYLPAPVEWTLSLFSPFAFTLGMAQLLRVDYDLNSNAPPDPASGSNLIIATNFMLVFDAFLYLALMMYFEKVLPNEYGHQHSPLFFLKSSFWLQTRKPAHVILEDGIDPVPSSGDSFEPVSPEFHGKESIRIRNISKEYKGKPNKIEALKDLTLDIYEGQITAVLGHSGAGKSTLLNILSGLSVPTKGSVTIYNNNLSEMADLENILRIAGVCPQANVQFDFLTVRENLRLFAKIRGIPPQDVEKEVQRVLLELEMKNIQNILAQNLSGGQKRKLTFGIAILGDSQIFLLDEPTAGLDPFSRHRVWNLLKERRADRVVLFSTQFMDEADILADRKVFISNGRLKCAGSSLFLKKKWGVGYHLSLQLKEVCVPENITSLVKQHIPAAKLSAEGEGKLLYTLPLETTYRFPELCQSLDSCPGLGIENYGVSMTTLNEVFLKLEGKASIDEPEVDIVGEGQTERSGDTERLMEMEQTLSSLRETEKTDGMALWRQQTCAIAKVRLLKLKHERKTLLSVLLILVVGICPFLFENISTKIRQSSYTWELSPHDYFLAPGQQPQGMLTQLLIINKTEASIDDFIHSVERQNIALEVDASGTRDGTDDPSYNGALIVSGNEKNHSFSFACNTKRLNCFPVLMDILSNGLLGMVKPSARIQTDRSTYLMDETIHPLEDLWKTAFWLILTSACPPYIAMSSVTDYKNRAWFQLRVSGLFPSAYWVGQAMVDIPLYCFVFLFMSLMDYLFRFPDTMFSIISHVIQIPCSVGYAISLIFLTYVISFISRKGKKNSGIWSLSFYIITVFSVAVILLAFDVDGTQYYIIFLIPPSTLVGCLILSLHLFIGQIFEEGQVIEPFLVFLIFGKKTMRKDPIFRISPRNNDVYQNPEEPEDEDEDVQMERMRTANALVSTSFDEKPVIIASCLRKEYAGKQKHCLSKKKAKIATRNVSFCVRKGEILGLLGHNGAGKSTSLKMISGDTKVTAGQVLLKGSREGDTPGFLGYCPQENALWPNLTVKEHLEIFAAVRGLRKSHAAVAITRLADALKLQDQLKSPVKTLSEGVKRKLCFVLSILGNPSILLLDEPSTGLDPEGQQQIWQAIRAIIKNTDRGALLTTHYMAEAEALCDRVAILVSGRLRCIGSIQHLKSKFGKDYLLEMKVKTLEQVEPLNTEILRLFPQASRQERYSSLMAYKLPVEAVQPLSQAFFKLEKVKQTFDLEEYSLSQSTLEQVFLELSKEQELDGLELEELDSSIKWKLLPQEEA